MCRALLVLALTVAATYKGTIGCLGMTGVYAKAEGDAAPPASMWSEAGQVDPNLPKVVSGIADMALTPDRAEAETVLLLESLTRDLSADRP